MDSGSLVGCTIILPLATTNVKLSPTPITRTTTCELVIQMIQTRAQIMIKKTYKIPFHFSHKNIYFLRYMTMSMGTGTGISDISDMPDMDDKMCFSHSKVWNFVCDRR